jgi:hypothetical protein
MITNAHVHLIQLDRMVEAFTQTTVPAGLSVIQGVEDILPLLSLDALLKQMDEAGIDRAILYAVEAPLVYSSNEFVEQICQAHPDRFTGFASVNPLDPDAPRTLRRLVTEHGFAGLKLHPPLQGFYPNDQAAFDVYRACVELDIPVVFHVGSTPFGSLCRLDTANPLLLDEVAVALPDLRIMLTHLGTLWHNEAFMVVEKNPNVFIDTAAYIEELPHVLTPDLVDRIGPHKIIFGTDYPMPSPRRGHRMNDFVAAIRDLELPEDVKEGIFHGNLQALLSGSAAATGQVPVDQILAELSAKISAAAGGDATTSR